MKLRACGGKLSRRDGKLQIFDAIKCCGCPTGKYWNGVECKDKVIPPPYPGRGPYPGTEPNTHYNSQLDIYLPNCVATACMPGQHWNPLTCQCEDPCTQPTESCNYDADWNQIICQCLYNCDPQICAAGYFWESASCRCVLEGTGCDTPINTIPAFIDLLRRYPDMPAPTAPYSYPNGAVCVGPFSYPVVISYTSTISIRVDDALYINGEDIMHGTIDPWQHLPIYHIPAGIRATITVVSLAPTIVGVHKANPTDPDSPAIFEIREDYSVSGTNKSPRIITCETCPAYTKKTNICGISEQNIGLLQKCPIDKW